MQVRSLGGEDPLEKDMTTHSSILAWRIPWTEEPGGQQSMGLQRVGHDWSDLAPRLAHQSLELDSDSEPVLSEGKAFSLFPRRCHLSCILTCIKCYFNTNSRPWIKMPVPWVGLAVLFLSLIFQKIKSRGEESKGVERQWRLLTRGSGPLMPWMPGPRPKAGRCLLLQSSLLGLTITVSDVWRMLLIQSGIRTCLGKYSNTGLRDDEWSLTRRGIAGLESSAPGEAQVPVVPLSHWGFKDWHCINWWLSVMI